MHNIKAFITEAKIYDIFDLFRRKPRGLGFNDTDVIVIEAKSKEGDIRVKENFFTCLKGNGTFSLKAPSRMSRATRGRLARFLTYYHLTDDPEKYDLLIIPGGSPDGAPTTIRNIKKAREIAKSFFAKNKPVASICHGPYALVSAGLVKGRHLTSYWHDGVPEEIKKSGGIWEDKDVVVDGNLVTSRWPMDLPAFMGEVIKLVSKNLKK